ncbi:hypothetical protein [Streptomyces sp. NPDC057403]|uniref:hypothetical protein n=1 Tax=Streptomyces sp. NPDC057403 TaxID=3346119 RepID=UPI0036AE0C82
MYDPTAGYIHFVLYSEPKYGIVGAAWNGTVSIEQESPYVQEWLGRLQPSVPNTLHTTLVESDKIADLFHACVDDDKDSPAAVSGSGCLCYRSFTDPKFGLPVVAHHYRTVGGNIDQWTYKAYAPLDLRPGDEFHRLIIDRTSGMFWIRTRDGLLSILPEEHGRAYGSGYGGGGPSELARYITALLDSGGEQTAAAGDRRHNTQPDPKVFDWVSSEAATRTQELSYDDLAGIRNA